MRGDFVGHENVPRTERRPKTRGQLEVVGVRGEDRSGVGGRRWCCQHEKCVHPKGQTSLALRET